MFYIDSSNSDFVVDKKSWLLTSLSEGRDQSINDLQLLLFSVKQNHDFWDETPGSGG